jgi:hypothetical protein
MKENTYRREKQIIVSAISLILVLIFYSLYVYNKYIAGNLQILNDLKFLGKAFLILIPVIIVSQIIIHIIFFIINKIVTNEDVPTITDEMDKLIELKALRIFHWTNSLGFILAIGSLAIGMQPWVMFITLVASCFVATTASAIAKIYYYRRGF